MSFIALTISLSFKLIVAPYLVHARYYNEFQRVTIPGGERTRLFSGGTYPRALAFDYRYINLMSTDWVEMMK